MTRRRITRAYVRTAPARSQAPRTIEDLLDPQRVWVTPCGCHLWLGADDGYGDQNGRGAYGRILRPGTRLVMPVHRYVFETFKGPIPDGWHVDHLCAAWALDPLIIRRCVNLDHLEAVPHKINQQRKILRRLGYLTDDLDLPAPIEPPQPAPILAPGERPEDLQL